MNGAAIAASLVLLMINAWFVALEFALLASRKTQMLPAAEAGRRSAVAAVTALEARTIHLAGAQLGITMASLGLGAVAEPAIAHAVSGPLENTLGLSESLVHPVALALALSVVVTVHMIFGEMVPKNLAIASPERTLQLLSLPNRYFQAFVRPVVSGLNGAADLLVRMMGIQTERGVTDAHTPEELAALIYSSAEGGALAIEEQDLLYGALGLATSTAGEVMVPRDEVVCVSAAADLATVERRMSETGHSRLPVVRGSIDDVAGFVHIKDVLVAQQRQLDGPLTRQNLGVLVRRMLVVGIDERLENVLLRMRAARVHFALVTEDPDQAPSAHDQLRRGSAPRGAGARNGNVRGVAVGIVTLEDVLEALVGDILDETDERGEGH